MLIIGKKLTQAEEQKVKLSAKNLFKKLSENKADLLVVDWYKDEQPLAKVKSAIEVSLDSDLPESYDRISLDNKNEFLPLDKMYELAYLMCRNFINLQVIFGIYIGDSCYHIHFAVNPVSIIDGSKFCLTNSNIYELTKRTKELLKLYSINKLGYINKPVVHGFKFAEELYNGLE